MNSQIPRSGSSMSGSTVHGTQSENRGAASASQDTGAKAAEPVSKFAETAQQMGDQAKQVASSLAAEANQRAKGLLNQQISAGADLVSNVADSAKSAADSLAQDAPQLAQFIRKAADRVEDFSHDMRGQSVDELLRNASDFTRRQPALVFGLAALAGFSLFRVLKANPETSTAGFAYEGEGAGYQPDPQPFSRSASEFHGT